MAVIEARENLVIERERSQQLEDDRLEFLGESRFSTLGSGSARAVSRASEDVESKSEWSWMSGSCVRVVHIAFSFQRLAAVHGIL